MIKMSQSAREKLIANNSETDISPKKKLLYTDPDLLFCTAIQGEHLQFTVYGNVRSDVGKYTSWDIFQQAAFHTSLNGFPSVAVRVSLLETGKNKY